jgi:hypothetical protein
MTVTLTISGTLEGLYLLRVVGMEEDKTSDLKVGHYSADRDHSLTEYNFV